MMGMKHIKKFINESDEEAIDWLVDMGLAGGGGFSEALEIPVLNRILDRLGREVVGVGLWNSGAEDSPDWAQLAMPEEEWIKDELLIIGSDLEDIVVAGWKTKVRVEENWYGVGKIYYQVESKKLAALGINKY